MPLKRINLIWNLIWICGDAEDCLFHQAGTFITEWEGGSALLSEIREKQLVDQVARQLASVASTHGFDGWLMNIESALVTGHDIVSLHGNCSACPVACLLKVYLCTYA